jgi:two-component system, sensor histidine kinase YesM
VENAIKHGLGMVLNGGQIWISVARLDGRVVMKVEDNGAGMDPEKIDQLMQHIRRVNTESEHMGLRNIYMRLKYFYDDDVEFGITRADSITSVRISLPCKEPW